MIRYPLYVTIDTNIFDSTGYDLGDNGTLGHLYSYVQSGKIKIVLSNIVIREAQKHIKEKAYEIATLSKKLRDEIRSNKLYSDNFVIGIEMGHLIDKVNRNVLAEKAKANLDAFIDKLNVEIMDSSQVDVEQIFDDYFSYAAPFENNEKKRKEFPDAFIAAQIRKRFSNNDLVAIISNDNGFKKACGKNGKMLFLDSLGQLYNLLSKEEKTYSEAVSSINDIAEPIGREIESIILDNDSIAVAGMSYDKDGIAEGYDYDETYVEHISNMRVRIHTIDEIQDNQVFATLLCTAKIQMSCFFEDYDNAAWDSDTDSYIFVETRKMIENHNAKFAIRIEYNLETREYSLSKFKVFLGGDTRTDRFEITDEEENDYEREIEDMDRESVGLIPFSGYESFLEENLVDCDMQQDIISRFERINEIYQCFEELVANYDELIDILKKSDKAKEIVAKIVSSETELKDFPVEKGDDITEEVIEQIVLWLEKRCDELGIFVDANNLPDTINYGEDVSFLGAEDEKIMFSIDAINIHPSEGVEEYIDISLSCASWTEAYKGYVKLTVGYMNYNDDGGVTDGLSDEIDYYYERIVDKLDEVIIELQKRLDLQHDFSYVFEDM